MYLSSTILFCYGIQYVLVITIWAVFICLLKGQHVLSKYLFTLLAGKYHFGCFLYFVITHLIVALRTIKPFLAAFRSYSCLYVQNMFAHFQIYLNINNNAKFRIYILEVLCLGLLLNIYPSIKLQYYFMGQDHPERSPRKNSIKKSNFLQDFVRDPRLIQRIVFIPELFAGSIDADIKKVQRLIQTLPFHPLQTHITDSLNERFENIRQTKKIEIIPIKNQNQKQREKQLKQGRQKQIETKKGQQTIIQQGNKNFYELQTQERFLELLKKFQHWFYIQRQLLNGLLANKASKKITVRKKVIVNYQSQLDKLLYSKLYLIYYLIILKKNLASKDKERKIFMVEFHHSIGKMICQMIENDHFNQKKLLQLSYKVIYLEKLDSKSKLKLILNQIKQQFRPLYLTKQHSLLLKPSQYDRIRQISRLYLDQLYLKSLKQAEDPEIIVDSNDGFGLVRSFPIIRVRQDRNK